MLRDWAKFAGFSALLAFFLTATFLWALQPSIQIHKWPENAEEQSEIPSPPTFASWRIILPGQLEAITEYCNAHSESEKKKWPQAYYCDVKISDTYIAFFTGLLFFVTTLLAAVTFGLVLMAIRQEKMARTHERAYVFGGGPVQAHKNGRPIPNKSTMSVENYGRTPATISKVEWGLCPAKDFPKDIPVSRIIDDNLLPAGTVNIVSINNVLPANTPPSIFTEKIEFSHAEHLGKIFFGKFNYKDVFGDDHYSTFKLLIHEGGSDGLEGCYNDWK